VDGSSTRDVRLRFDEDVESAARRRAAGAPTRLTDVRPMRTAGFATGYEFEIRNWARDRRPVVASFKSDWSLFKSVGSCMVRLPDLITSIASYEVGQRLYGEDADEVLGRVGGAGTASVVFPPETPVDTDASSPSPTREFGIESWRCTSRLAAATGPDGSEGRPPA
jgi:hypothetical protein